MSRDPHDRDEGGDEDEFPGPLSRPAASSVRQRSVGTTSRAATDLNLISPWDMSTVGTGNPAPRGSGSGGGGPMDHSQPRQRASHIRSRRRSDHRSSQGRMAQPNRTSSMGSVNSSYGPRYSGMMGGPPGGMSAPLSPSGASYGAAPRLSEYSRNSRPSEHSPHRDSAAHSALLSKRACYSLRRQSLRRSSSIRYAGGRSSVVPTRTSAIPFMDSFSRLSFSTGFGHQPSRPSETTSLLPMQRSTLAEEEVAPDEESTSMMAEDDESGSMSHQSSPQGSIHSLDKDEYDEFEDYEESTIEALRDIISGNSSSVLLFLLPCAWLSHYLAWSSGWVFWLNFLACIPLAAIMGDFTEEVAMNTNATVGGMVNALFGKSVEIVFGVQAIMANELRVVQSTMIGTVFSNLLLVLGSCFLFGGLKYKEQRFNSTAANANMGLLALSSIALVLPTPFADYYDVQDDRVLTISRIASVFLIFMYIQLLVFQLRTHAYLFDEGGGGATNYIEEVEVGLPPEEEPEEFEEFEDDARISMTVAVSGLVTATLCLIICSSYLIDSLDGCCGDTDVGRTFIGLVILPIVGNAVEHSYAVTVAMEDKLDLAMGVAVGSCLQISLYAAPLTVLVGWCFDKNMTLNFPHFEIYLYIMSIVTVAIVLSNPTAVWLEGSLLITTYLMIAVGFYFEKVKDFY